MIKSEEELGVNPVVLKHMANKFILIKFKLLLKTWSPISINFQFFGHLSFSNFNIKNSILKLTGVNNRIKRK